MPTVRAQLICHSPERLPQILAGSVDPKEILATCSFYPLGWEIYREHIALGEVNLSFDLPPKAVEAAIAGVRSACTAVDAKAEEAKTNLRRIEQSLLALGWEGKQ